MDIISLTGYDTSITRNNYHELPGITPGITRGRGGIRDTIGRLFPLSSLSGGSVVPLLFL